MVVWQRMTRGRVSDAPPAELISHIGRSLFWHEYDHLAARNNPHILTANTAGPKIESSANHTPKASMQTIHFSPSKTADVPAISDELMGVSTGGPKYVTGLLDLPAEILHWLIFALPTGDSLVSALLAHSAFRGLLSAADIAKLKEGSIQVVSGALFPIKSNLYERVCDEVSILPNFMRHGPSIKYFYFPQYESIENPDLTNTICDTGIHNIWYVANYREGLKHGPTIEYQTPGHAGMPGPLAYFTEYADDQLHGVAKAWNAAGIITRERNYVNGIRHGKTLRRCWNGTRYMEKNYKHGKLHGAWIVYAGSLSKVTYYENGVKLMSA